MPQSDILDDTVAYAAAEELPDSSLRGRVAIVETGADGATQESLRSLRQRLGTLCGILLVGFTAFLIRQLFSEGLSSVLRWNWTVVFATLLTAAALLALPLPPRRGLLKTIQALIFTGAAWFFAVTMHTSVPGNLSPSRISWAVFNLVNGTTWFCVLSFTYAILFPGSWRRVALAVSLLLTIPACVMLYDRHSYPPFAEAVIPPMVTLILMTLATCDGVIVFLAYRFTVLEREAAIGRRFGQYRLKRRIGAGGMGEVYLAEHVLLKRPCALKRIRPDHNADPVTLARFEREVRATAELSHPHTVEIYDYGRSGDGTFYYVMEYLWGLSLEDLVKQFGPLPAPRVVFLLSQVCEALEEAHSAGLIHRDIKPGNIFAARRGGRYDFVKLLDFGLVKAVTRRDDPNVSRPDNVVGSPFYMAPEQFRGDTPDPRADVYAMGAVGYFLLTGRPPFVGSTSYDIMVAHARDPITPPSQLAENVPRDVEALLLRCLSKDPVDRFQSAVDLGRALATSSAAAQWTGVDAAVWWQAHSGGGTTAFLTPAG
jgi:eukaryotic-like serine/threonine-protein kinase